MRKDALKPYPGMPVTYVVGTDKYAHKITSVSKGLNEVIIDDGTKFTLRRDGVYKKVGTIWVFLILGEAVTDLDRDF